MTNNEWELDNGNHMLKIQKALGSIPSNKRNKKLKESFSFERYSLLLCVCNVCVWTVGSEDNSVESDRFVTFTGVPGIKLRSSAVNSSHLYC